jgi:lipopolysaccharide transport system ATP-binding protein
MSEVIKIENLSKVYRRQNKREGKTVIEDFWALRDFSLSVNQGDILGIIGKNGAGKSTLLKILSKITTPTRGRVIMNGRVGSLLEVGTGFHPEMTGRENIYMNGNILGMSNAEINRKLDEIVDFSGVGDFLETPVKRYSSGMQTRLAFAVAAHLEPEILIIDEVLSVGDAEFQKKCLNKMDDIGNSGRTILFVSHGLDAVRNLCSRCIWLHNGELRFEDKDSNLVIGKYLNYTNPTNALKYYWDGRNTPTKISSPIELDSFYLTDEKGVRVEHPVLASDILSLNIHFRCKEPQKNLSIGFYLFNVQNQLVYLSLSTDSKKYNDHNYASSKYKLSCMLPSNILTDGDYYLKLALGVNDQQAYYSPENSDVGILLSISGNVSRSNLWRSHRTQQVYPILDWVKRGADD